VTLEQAAKQGKCRDMTWQTRSSPTVGGQWDVRATIHPHSLDITSFTKPKIPSGGKGGGGIQHLKVSRLFDYSLILKAYSYYNGTKIEINISLF